VGLEGVTDRSAAEALTGAEVVVARGRLPQPEADSFYWTDLIGLTVATMDGKPLGNLVRILETGANDVYVVRQGKRETLVPALAAVVRRVDLEQRRMWVELPEGL
jgi:16S rRNA processing protein RimM